MKSSAIVTTVLQGLFLSNLLLIFFLVNKMSISSFEIFLFLKSSTIVFLENNLIKLFLLEISIPLFKILSLN